MILMRALNMQESVPQVHGQEVPLQRGGVAAQELGALRPPASRVALQGLWDSPQPLCRPSSEAGLSHSKGSRSGNAALSVSEKGVKE